MRIKRKKKGTTGEFDLTPMIDMTFQLIAFFTVLYQVDQAETKQDIELSHSEIAIPPEDPIEFPITLHVNDEDIDGDGRKDIYLGSQTFSTKSIGPFLDQERETRLGQGMKAAEITVIIRADKAAQTGDVQEVIKVCQEHRLEKFALRAQHQPPD